MGAIQVADGELQSNYDLGMISDHTPTHKSDVDRIEICGVLSDICHVATNANRSKCEYRSGAGDQASHA